MSLRPFLTFEADFPDDAEWDENQELVVPGGKAMISAIREQVEGRGYACTAVEQHSYFGWRFDARRSAARVQCLVQLTGPWLLMTTLHHSMTDRLTMRRRDDEHESFVSLLQEILSHDSRFSCVKSYTREEYEHTSGPGCP